MKNDNEQAKTYVLYGALVLIGGSALYALMAAFTAGKDEG